MVSCGSQELGFWPVQIWGRILGFRAFLEDHQDDKIQENPQVLGAIVETHPPPKKKVNILLDRRGAPDRRINNRAPNSRIT